MIITEYGATYLAWCIFWSQAPMFREALVREQQS